MANSIWATIGYIADIDRYKEEIPYYLLEVDPTPSVPHTNIEIVPQECAIRDIREQNPAPCLESNGFQLCYWPHDEIRFDSNTESIQMYCRDMAHRLKNKLQADQVYVFDYRLRSSDFHDVQSAQTNSTHQNRSHQPVSKAHLDQTQEGGLRRLKLHLTVEEFSKYHRSSYRIRIINVWRSFNELPQDMPLAFCAPRSVESTDPIAVEIIEPHRVAQNYYLRYNAKHEWFWASDMKPSEVMAFVTWDSKVTEQITNCAYHSAFRNPSSVTEARKSMEVRIIVINEEV